MKKSAARRFSVVRTLRHVRIRYRLLASFLLLSLVPALCVGLYASGVYARAMSGKLRQSAEQSAYLLNENFITELNKFRGYLNTISVTDAVQNALSAQQESAFTLDAESVNEIADALRMIPFQSTYLKNIRVVDRDHNILYDLGYDDISRERFAEVLRVIDETAGYDSLQYIRTYRNYDKIVLGRKIYKFGSVERPIGYILAYIDESFVSDVLLANVSFGAGSNVMLLNEAGQVISSQDKALLGSGYLDSGTFAELRAAAQAAAGQTVSAPIPAGGIQALSISVYDRELNSYLVITIPQSYFTEETRQINRSLILVCVLLIVLSLLCTTVVYSSIMQPINHMVAMCNITSDADLDKSIDDQSKDELGFLARTIDNMIAEMKQLGIQYAADQRQKRKLELEMLQYQINPHFLFNTLGSLRFVAQLNDVPVLEEGISSLSSLLRHSLVKKQELIPISAEIENLRNYFTLQKIRYAGMFEVEYRLEPQTLGCEIPRFTLQPLAENAIIHGTADGRCITITVESRFKGADIELLLRDNGCGFDMGGSAEKAAERFSGIGLSNVDQRLHLHYGKGYGLQVTSSPNTGTCCRILLPQRIWKEESNDVSGSAG